jgi:4-oxalomesaconate tautomerase
MLMRGGSSKGAYFLASDLPSDPLERNDLLLRILGSPDSRQIDGVGGGHPLTSKVAIVSASDREDVDVDYLFLQVGVDDASVGDKQTCGNLLAGIGPFAVERGLVATAQKRATVRIRLRNTGDVATAVFAMADGHPDYDGRLPSSVSIDGVPGTASPIELDVDGSGSLLLPTGHPVDEIGGHRVTMIDNGMPVVLLTAGEFGVVGTETPEELEANDDLGIAVERIRLEAGRRMGLGDVSTQTVPKMVLLSRPRHGGAVSTRTFIPSRVHPAIGVLMAASVAAALQVPGTVGTQFSAPRDDDAMGIEHPSGTLLSRVHVELDAAGTWRASSRSQRTARKLFDGVVYPRARR